ncbi:hypothetical protein PF002_g21658 [Phytophthora fragariae]|nr:hypothetical protein PF006_g18948 [Phytophthora fragariae]KAE9201039.1 hypothetical protein PF002_g21658 [Phytophthora fragariae]
MNADAQLEDILQANGEGYLYEQILQLGHPPVVFCWQEVEKFVLAVETARAEAEAQCGKPLPPDPLQLPTVVTVENFKEAVLNYLKPQEDSGLLGTSCLLCSLPESVTDGYKLRALDEDPWIQRILAVEPSILPIARVYMPRGLRSGALDLVTPHQLISLWGY